MSWESNAINTLAEDQLIAASIREELNNMPEGGEAHLSLAAKIQIAKYGIRTGHHQYNDALWLTQSRYLNKLLAKPQTCADVVTLFESLEQRERDIYLGRRGHSNFSVFEKFKKVMNNPHSSAVAVFDVMCLDKPLFRALLSSHPHYREKFLSLVLKATGHHYKTFIDFIVTHPELAADFNNHLTYIVSHSQSSKETATVLTIREQVATGDGMIRHAIRNNPKYFSTDPDLYVKLLAKEKSEVAGRIDVEARTSIGWRVVNALKFLIPRFLRDYFNIEPPLRTREFNKLHEILTTPAPTKGTNPYQAVVLKPAPARAPAPLEVTYVQTPIKGESTDSAAYRTSVEDSAAYRTPPKVVQVDKPYVQTPVDESQDQVDSGLYQTRIQSSIDHTAVIVPDHPDFSAILGSEDLAEHFSDDDPNDDVGPIL